MNLRRKLLTVFGALALLALLTAGVTLWVLSQWRTTNERTENHYQRSLLLQRVRATMFRAFKEVPDAVTGDDKDSREEFIKYLRPAEEDFKRWAELADSEDEREQVRQVRAAYDVLVADANQTFDLVDAGRMREAFDLMEGKLEDQDFVTFENLSEEAVASDRRNRQLIRENNERTRRTAQIVLTIAAFATLSLVLLLAAYLASDLFAPLREVKTALERAAQGDWNRLLNEERADEFGEINRAFNQMAAAGATREQRAGMQAAATGDDDDPTGEDTWQQTTSRLTLHTLVAQMRARVKRLAQNGGEAEDSPEVKRQLIEKVEQLAQAVVRVTEFGFPLDLNLANTDVRELLYEVLLRFHEDLSTRGVGLEIEVAPDVAFAIVDRLKLREALGELVRNALRALPERGGKIGLRARLAQPEGDLIIEVADNSGGTDEPLVDQTFGDGDNNRYLGVKTKRAGVGLKLVKAIVEQHGGEVTITSEQGEGTYVQMRLPLRA